MRAKTTIMTALLCLTAVTALPAPAAADPAICGLDCLIICDPDFCPSLRCTPVFVGVEAHALGNNVAAQVTVNQNCQVSETGVPLPPYYCPCFPLINIDPSQATEVCLTVAYGTTAPATICFGIDQNTGCVSANGETVGCPVPPTCAYPPPPVGGVIGQAIAYAEELGTIACQAAAATADVAGDAAAATVGYVESQIPCANGCYYVFPPWVMAYANALVGIAVNEGAGQAGLLCNLLLGSDVCNAIAPATTTGTCPVSIPRDDGGIVGDIERYIGGSCDLAYGDVGRTLTATKVFTSNLSKTVSNVVGSIVPTVETELAQAEAYVDAMTGYATTEAGILTTAVTSSCTATTTLLTGGSCPV